MHPRTLLVFNDLFARGRSGVLTQTCSGPGKLFQFAEHREGRGRHMSQERTLQREGPPYTPRSILVASTEPLARGADWICGGSPGFLFSESLTSTSLCLL